MIVVVNMKNVIQRGETYYFRRAVPKDCVEEIGQSEIVESLRTKNPLAADRLAEPLREKWKKRFKEVRQQSGSDFEEQGDDSSTGRPNYDQFYFDLMQDNLTALMNNKTEEELVTECLL